MHTKRQKFRALLLCAVVFAAVFFSVLLIAGKAGHDCKGAGCHVCAVLHEAEQALDQLGTGAPGGGISVSRHDFGGGDCLRQSFRALHVFSQPEGQAE